MDIEIDLDKAFAELTKLREEEYKKAPKCFRCFDRCDSPFGNGTLCNVCRSKPTSKCMSIVINI